MAKSVLAKNHSNRSEFKIEHRSRHLIDVPPMRFKFGSGVFNLDEWLHYRLDPAQPVVSNRKSSLIRLAKAIYNEVQDKKSTHSLNNWLRSFRSYLLYCDSKNIGNYSGRLNQKI